MLSNPKASVDKAPDVGPKSIDLVGMDAEVFALVFALPGAYSLGILPPLVADNLMVPIVLPVSCPQK